MVSAKKTRLQQRKEEGNQGAAAALELLDDPNQRYLSAIQVMITLIDTLAAVLAVLIFQGRWLTSCAK